ncbi:MAG: hypothetical protein AB7L90_07490 [Hyphomicrobiaceae bacterium]
MSSVTSPDAGLGAPRVAGSELQQAWRTSSWIVLGLWMLYASPWLLGRVTIPYDAKALFQAQLQFLANALHSGQSPAWNPHTFVGIPQIADPQSLIFSPALLLAALTKSPSFWLLDFYVFAMLGLGAAAVLLFFRDRGWHPGGAAVAALCFAFGGSASWRMQHIGQIQSYALFAVTLWLLFRARDRHSLVWGAAAGFSAGLMLAGPNQVALLASYLLVVIAIADWLTAPSPWHAFRRDVWLYGVAAMVALAVAALPLLLAYAFLETSNRPSIAFHEAARGSLHPASLLTFLLPDLFGITDTTSGYWGPYSEAWDRNELTLSPNMSQLYMGALPCLALLRGALTRGTLRRTEVVGVSTAALIALVYALGSFTPLFHLAYDAIPGVDLFRRPADATFLLGGLAAILAGYVIHCHLEAPPRPAPAAARLAWIIVATAIVVGAGLALAHGRLSTSLVPIARGVAMLALAGGILALSPARLTAAGRFAAFIPALLVGADLIISNGPSEATGKPADRAQEALRLETHNETVAFLSRNVRRATGTPWRDRIEMAGVGFDWQNNAEAHGLDQTLGYNPLRTDLVTRALGADDYIAGYDQRRFSRLFPSYRCRLADLLGLRFIATPVPIRRLDPRIHDDDLNFVAHTLDAYIYENPRTLPRVLFAEHARTADFERILSDGRWPDFDPRQTVLFDLVEKPVLTHRQALRTMSSFPAATPPAESRLSTTSPVDWSELAPVEKRSEQTEEPEAVITRYENTRVEIEVNAPRPGFLVLNDVWHPWWRATVDGATARIRRANVLFRAVAVQSGRHRVRFTFHPISGALSGLWSKPLPPPR